MIPPRIEQFVPQGMWPFTTLFKNKIVFPCTGNIYSLILKRSRDRFSQKKKKKKENLLRNFLHSEDDYAEVPLLLKFFYTLFQSHLLIAIYLLCFMLLCAIYCIVVSSLFKVQLPEPCNVICLPPPPPASISSLLICNLFAGWGWGGGWKLRNYIHWQSLNLICLISNEMLDCILDIKKKKTKTKKKKIIIIIIIIIIIRQHRILCLVDFDGIFFSLFCSKAFPFW